MTGLPFALVVVVFVVWSVVLLVGTLGSMECPPEAPESDETGPSR